MPPPFACKAPRALEAVRDYLPKGGTLPPEEWRRRHRVLVAVLWLNAVGLSLYGLVLGRYTGLHEVTHGLPLAAFAALAGSARFGRKPRSVFASLGLLTAAALLVHLTGGLIEAHFYFFVLIVALTLYEDWIPFLAAVAYVLLHHGVVGMLEPHEVYNRPEAWADPWFWAGVHALFVAFAGVAGVLAWRLNENVRDRMRANQVEIERLAETDSLTGLANRRRAMADLDGVFGLDHPPGVLMIFDLDGFKAYNESFGHPAGDALLTRLGQRLATSVAGRGTSSRPAPAPSRRRSRSPAALSEHGNAFEITASFGSVLIPDEASTPSQAMHLADQRMYARKQTSRPSALSQSEDVLLQALAERHPDLRGHLGNVRDVAEAVDERLGCPTTRSRRCATQRNYTTSERWRSRTRSSGSPVRSTRRNGASSGATRSSASASWRPRPCWPARVS